MAVIIPLSDLTKAITVDEWKTSIYNALATTGVTTTNWKPGAVVRTIIAGLAICLGACSQLVALIAKSGFVSLATGLWLNLAAFYERGVTRQEDTFAIGVCLLSNSSGNVYDFDPGDLVIQSSVTDQTYTNITTIHVGIGASNIAGTFQSDEAGAAATAYPGEIDTVVTPGLTGLTVTNPDALIALDAESDEALRAKCDEKLGALSPNGPADAYAYAARTFVLDDGTPLGVTRVKVVPDTLGGADVYVATASGGVAGSSGSPETPLGALHDFIQKNFTPICVTERTHSATNKPINVTYTAWMYNTLGLTETQIKDGIAASLSALLPAQPIGGNVVPPATGKIYHEHIEAAIVRAVTVDGVPMGIFKADVTTPAGDVDVTSLEAPTTGTITATAIVQLAPPAGSLL